MCARAYKFIIFGSTRKRYGEKKNKKIEKSASISSHGVVAANASPIARQVPVLRAVSRDVVINTDDNNNNNYNNINDNKLMIKYKYAGQDRVNEVQLRHLSRGASFQ